MPNNLTAAKRFIEAFMALVVGRRVPVRWGSTKVASMDTNRIVSLPAPTTGEADELALLTRLGFHEAGHMLHTEPGFEARLTPEEGCVWNALEDPRMERQLMQTYPGASVVLSRGLDRLLAVVQERLEKDVSGSSLSPACMDLFFRGMLAMAPHKAAVHRVPGILQSLAPHVTDVQRAAIDEALSKLPNFTNSIDCEEAAKAFVARLREQEQEQEMVPPQASGEPQDQQNQEDQEEGSPEGQPNASEQTGDPGQGGGNASQEQQDASQGQKQQGSDLGDSQQEQDMPQGGDTLPPHNEGAGPEKTTGAEAQQSQAGDGAGGECGTEATKGTPSDGAGGGDQQGDVPTGDASGASESSPNMQSQPSEAVDPRGDASGNMNEPANGSAAQESSSDPAASSEVGGVPSNQAPGEASAPGGNLQGDVEPADLGQLLRQVLADRYGNGESRLEVGEDEAKDRGSAHAETSTEPTVADLQRLAVVLETTDADLNELVAASLAAVARATDQSEADATSGGGAGLSLAATPMAGGPLPERSRLEGVQGKLVTVLRRELQDKRRRPGKPARAGSRVIADRFWRLSALGDTKVFAQRHKVNGIDAAATVLLDSSDSMAPIFDVAVDSTLAFSLALQRLGVRTKVVRFPGAETLCETLQEFGESPRGCKERCAQLVASGGTPIGAATAVETQDLLLQRRLTNMLALITDGQPGDRDTYRAALQLADQQGVLVVGVGIGCDISQWVQNSVMVSNVIELPDALAQLFRNNISEKLAA